MIKIILFICMAFPTLAIAGTLTIPTTYATNGTVTASNLNGNFTAIAQVVNGGIDNTNANTTSGYRLYQTVSTLPSAGNQGAVYFLTTDNTLNFDTGSSFIKTIAISGTPSTGYIPYYNSGWTSLVPGAQYLPLVSNGVSALPTYQTLPSNGGGTGANLSASAQGAVPYFSATGVMSGLAVGTSGQVLQTQGASANPIWGNSLSSVLDYGTSASSSTSRQGTALKVAFGHDISVAGGGSTALSNLPFTSSSSYTIICSANSSFGTPPAGTDQSAGNIVCTPGSGSAATIYNTDDQTKTVAWFAVGI